MKAHPAQGIAAFTLSLITASISCQAAAADPGVAATAEPIFLKYSSVNRAGLKKDYIGLVEEARFNPWILSGDGTRTVGPQKTAIHGGTPYLLYTVAGWTGFNYEMRPFAADQVTVRINYANRVLLESKEIGEVRAVNLGVCPADATTPKPEDCLFSDSFKVRQAEIGRPNESSISTYSSVLGGLSGQPGNQVTVQLISAASARELWAPVAEALRREEDARRREEQSRKAAAQSQRLEEEQRAAQMKARGEREIIEQARLAAEGQKYVRIAPTGRVLMCQGRMAVLSAMQCEVPLIGRATINLQLALDGGWTIESQYAVQSENAVHMVLRRVK